jgi:putative ABC transport system permease protein
MWAHYLLTFYRATTRHRLYAVLNVFGLAIGIAVFLVLWLDVRFETSFERWIPNARSIYVVRENLSINGFALPASDDTMGGLLDELRADYPQLHGARVWTRIATVRRGADVTHERLTVVDPTFFKIFDLPLAAGNETTLLRSPDELLVTESRARRYFGAADPIGQRLTIALNGRVFDYRVSGVLKDTPKNSDLAFDLVAPLTPQMAADQGQGWRDWGDQELTTYLRFAAPAGAANLDVNLDQFTDRHAVAAFGLNAHKHLKLRTRPLLSLHLIDPGDAAFVAIICMMGLLTVLLAGMNYVNLATARAGLRAREVALRKIMGATAPALIAQFMTEAVATAMIAALIGLGLCELSLPLINAAGGLSLKITYLGDGGVLPWLAGLALVVGLAAGVYPALILSQFEPAAVLASARAPGGGRSGARVREGLVFFQFAVAGAFIIATGVIVSQTLYVRTGDLGFDRHGLIIVHAFEDPAMTAASRSTLLTLWRGMPGVVSATASDLAPGFTGNSRESNFQRPGVKGTEFVLNSVVTSSDFIRTYGARLVAGRALDPIHGLDEFQTPTPEATAPRNAMLNLNAVHALGFANPQAAVGQIILKDDGHRGQSPFRIVGIIDNMRFQSPHARLPATVYLFTAQDFGNALAAVRYAQAAPGVIGRMRAAWRQVAPTAPFAAETIEDSLQPYYQADDQRGRLFILGAAMAVAIGCFGLYGLASFNTARRVREIGIRRTLGASTRDILRLLIGQFLRPVLLANVLAWPLAYIAMRSWLSGFDQRIALGPAYFLAAASLTLLVAVAAVAGQALAGARSDPAKALRHD